MSADSSNPRKVLTLPQPYRKRDMDEPGTESEFWLKLGDGKEYLITEKMAREYPYVADPEARLTRNFDDVYLILQGYSIAHFGDDLLKDKARLSIFRTNVLDFGIKLSDDDILMIQKDELDELATIAEYVKSKGTGWGNRMAAFSGQRKTRGFLAELRESFADLYDKMSPDHILDLLEAGKVKELVLKNWSTANENSVLMFVKRFTERFFR